MGILTFQAAAGGALNLNGPNIAGTVNLTLPSADGTSGQPLQTNGSGTLSFATLGTAAGGTGLTSFTSTGIPYASSTSALTTGSALTFDGTNFATTGTATAAKLIPTGTSVTGNGMYLPAANSLGFSTAGTNAVYINSSQLVGVGTTSPSGKVDAVSNAYSAFVARSSTSGAGQSVTALVSTDSTASNYAYGSYDAYAHLFKVSTVEVVRIDAAGNLGVGTTSPSGRITSIATGTLNGVYVTAVNNHGVFSQVSGTGYGFYGRSLNASYGGVLGYDSNNTAFGIVGYSGYGLYTNSSINVNGTVYTSDRRLKENDQNITNALSQVMQLRAVSFDWKADSSRGLQKGGIVPDYGFIAQEVETILPNLVYSTITPARPAEITSQISLEEELGEYKGIDYSRFVPFLTAAIQEQQTLITQLTDRIATLETK
jgi:Chaperone of endosialidase